MEGENKNDTTRYSLDLEEGLHVESKLMTSALCRYLSNIDIFQYVTQYSTYIRQNTLNFIILGLMPMFTPEREAHV